MSSRMQVMVLAYLILSAVPFALAQPGEEVGDHEYSSGPTVTGVVDRVWRPGSELAGYEDLDLQSLEMAAENQTHFTLHLGLGGDAVRSDPESRVLLARNYTIAFQFRAQAYEIRVAEENDIPLRATAASLARITGVARASTPLDFAPDSDNQGWTIVVPKTKITGAFQEPVLAGTMLEGIQVTAWADSVAPTQCNEVVADVNRCTLVLRDAMEVGDLVFSIHPEARGSLLAYALNPTIPTNGEATTHYFKVQTSNLGSEAATIELKITQQPDDWVAHLPANYALTAGESKLALVGFEIPFAHQHGVNKTALLQIQSTRDSSSQTQLPLTIEWVDPPQPSGHHPRLFFHADSEGKAWLNAAPSEDDVAIPFLATSCLACGQQSLSVSLQRQVSLSPKLALGLDVDVTQTGRMDLEVTSQIAGDFTAMGTIYLQAPADSPIAGLHVIFEVVEQTVSLQAANNKLSLELLPTAFSDYVDILSPTDVVLDLRLQGSTSPNIWAQAVSDQSNAIASISPSGSFILLPLNEFHPVDRELQALEDGSVAIAAPTEAETNGKAQDTPTIPAYLVLAVLALLGGIQRRNRA